MESRLILGVAGIDCVAELKGGAYMKCALSTLVQSAAKLTRSPSRVSTMRAPHAFRRRLLPSRLSQSSPSTTPKTRVYMLN